MRRRSSSMRSTADMDKRVRHFTERSSSAARVTQQAAISESDSIGKKRPLLTSPIASRSGVQDRSSIPLLSFRLTGQASRTARLFAFVAHIFTAFKLLQTANELRTAAAAYIAGQRYTVRLHQRLTTEDRRL